MVGVECVQGGWGNGHFSGPKYLRLRRACKSLWFCRDRLAIVFRKVWLRTEEYLKDALGSVVADIEDMAINLLTFVNAQVTHIS